MSDIINIEDVINDLVKLENEDVVKISNELFVVKSSHSNECTGCDLYPANNNDCLLNKKYLNKKNTACVRILENKILLKGGI